MPWTRIDDQWSIHPKVLRAGPAAMGFWMALSCYANRNLTDGSVPKSDLKTVWPGLTLRRIRVHVERLIANSLVHEDDTNLYIHDFLDYNDSRAEVLRKRAKSAKKKRRQRSGTTECPPGTHRGTPPVSTPGSPGSPDPDPDPVPPYGGVARAREAPPPTRPIELAKATPLARSHPYELFVDRWKATFEAARRQWPTRLDGAAPCVAWLTAEAQRLGVSFEEILEAKLAAYWAEEWPRAHRSNPSPANLHAQLPRLAAGVGVVASEVDLARAEFRRLKALVNDAVFSNRHDEHERLAPQLEAARLALRAVEQERKAS